MTRLYYREASACIIMFDVTNASTFSNSQKWKQDLDSKVLLPDGSPMPCLLLANKVSSNGCARRGGWEGRRSPSPQALPGVVPQPIRALFHPYFSFKFLEQGFFSITRLLVGCGARVALRRCQQLLCPGV